MTVTANPENKFFGHADPAFTYTSTSLIGNDGLTGALTRNQGEAPGNYAITQGSLTAGSNYQITYIGNDLTIKAIQPDNFLASLFQANLGRPIISVADKVINFYAPFEPHQTQTLDVDVSIRLQNPPSGGNGQGVAGNLANIEPAAGGDDDGHKKKKHKGPFNPQDLANIEPAAGGNGGKPSGKGSDFACADAFLDGTACSAQ